MAPTGFGKALAVRHDFAGDINKLYQQENLRQQVRVEKERKAQYYGELLKTGHVRGDYNTKRYEEHIKKVNGELADFVTNNPGWETDPGLFSQFINISDQYLNNDIMREDLQVQQNFETLQREISSGKMEIEEIEYEMRKYQNYTETGGDPYVFINPKRIEFGDVLTEGVKSIPFEKLSEHRGLEIYDITRAKAGSIQTAVNTQWADPKRKREILRQYENEKQAGIDVPETPIEFFYRKVEAQIAHQEAQSGWNQYELSLMRKAQEDLEDLPPESRYNRDAHLPYMAAWDHYDETGDIQDIVLSPKPANIALTLYGSTKQTATINAATGALFFDEKTGKSSPFSYNVSTQALSAGRFMTKSLKPYVEVEIGLSLPVDKNGEPIDAAMQENLIDNYGFKQSKTEIAGFMDLMAGDKINVKPQYLTGKILIPAQMDEYHQRAYDDMVYGEATMRKFDEYPTGYQRRSAEVLAVEINQKHPGANFKVVGNEIISEDGKYGVDPVTRQLYTR